MELPSIIGLSFLGALAVSIQEFFIDWVTGLLFFFPVFFGLLIGLGGYSYFKKKNAISDEKTSIVSHS